VLVAAVGVEAHWEVELEVPVGGGVSWTDWDDADLEDRRAQRFLRNILPGVFPDLVSRSDAARDNNAR
jgi:hypothetical protein